MKDYSGLKLRLEKESFPQNFLFKFIGKNSAAFEDGTRELEGKFPELVMENLRLSQNQGHAAYTYSLTVDSAQEVIEVYEAISVLSDLEVLL